ncbi:hypothetical protein SAMN05444714_0313 [Yoonia litorea]|uniref:DoxX-like family protein n=2 Tax=Yoonia litorea TaxID=1123755 RepID=A0A1I6L9A1_9RHOB|nr:hypothetical protein SAMN05444714_0313 [Yoonia litorea]
MTRSYALLALRLALTIAFIYYGLRKLGSDPRDVAIYEAIGFGQFPRFITGSVELIGAALLWVRGWRGIGGALLFVTMCIGLTALLLWVGPPYWHMLVLMAGSATIAVAYRKDITRRLPSGQ